MNPKNKKILILTSTHILAIVVGAVIVFVWIGLRANNTIYEANAMLTQVAIVSRYATFVDMTRTNGTKEEYKEALKNFLKAIDDAAKQPSSFYDQKNLYQDRTLTYERLSRLERELGNTGKAEEYMQIALDNCKNAGWKDCSVNKIVLISKKLEDNGLFSRSATSNK